MKLTKLLLCCCVMLSSCNTTYRSTKDRVPSVRLEIICFEKADVSDVLKYLNSLVDSCNPECPSSPQPILMKDIEKDEAKWQKLKVYCKGKTISLTVDKCMLIDLIDFVTKYAGVKYEIRNGSLIILSPEGDILAPMRE